MSAWQVEEKDDGKRLDIFLTYQLPKYSRSQVKRLIYDHRASVNGAVVEGAGYKLSAGDKVAINLRGADVVESNDIPAWDQPVVVVFENEYLLAVNKPAGMLVHPSSTNDTHSLLNAVSGYLGGEYLRLMHRLDRATSGVVLFSKHPRYTHILSQKISAGDADKYYLAVVEGKWDFPSNHLISLPLSHDEQDRKEVVDRRDGVSAVTEVLSSAYHPSQDVSLLKIKLHTGRKHQIRVHLSTVGFPVVGDSLYGGRKNDQLLLHAWQLRIEVEGQEINAVAQIPDYFSELIDGAESP